MGIFLLAVAVRWVYLRQATAHPLFGTPFGLFDSLHYHGHARALLGGTWIADTPYFLGPLYGHLLALIYWLFGVSIAAVHEFQVVLAGVSCVLLADIGRRAFDLRVGVLAGVGLALYGPHVYYTGHLLPTLVVVFLNLWVVWLLLRDAEAPSLGRAALAGFALGLAILAKSNALLLLPGVIAALLWLRRGDGAAPVLRWSAVFAGATLLTILPAGFHNFVASGELVPVTTSTGRNLWKGNGPVANGTHPLGHWEDDRGGLGRRLQGLVDAEEAVEGSSEYVGRTVAYVSKDPLRWLGLLVRKFVLFGNAVELGVRDQYYFMKERVPLLRGPLLGFALVAPLGLAGLLACARRLERCWPIALLLVCQAASFVIVFVLARYRLVAAACLLLFAAERLAAWWDAARAREWRAALPTLAVAALAAVFVNWTLAEFPRERGYAMQWERIGDQHRLGRRHAEAIEAYDRALVGDWQDLDPTIKRAETRLRIARTRSDLGDDRGALALVDEILAGATEDDARTRRLVRDAKRFAEQMGRRSPSP